MKCYMPALHELYVCSSNTAATNKQSIVSEFYLCFGFLRNVYEPIFVQICDLICRLDNTKQSGANWTESMDYVLYNRLQTQITQRNNLNGGIGRNNIGIDKYTIPSVIYINDNITRFEQYCVDIVQLIDNITSQLNVIVNRVSYIGLRVLMSLTYINAQQRVSALLYDISVQNKRDYVFTPDWDHFLRSIKIGVSCVFPYSINKQYVDAEQIYNDLNINDHIPHPVLR